MELKVSQTFLSQKTRKRPRTQHPMQEPRSMLNALPSPYERYVRSKVSRFCCLPLPLAVPGPDQDDDDDIADFFLRWTRQSVKSQTRRPTIPIRANCIFPAEILVRQRKTVFNLNSRPEQKAKNKIIKVTIGAATHTHTHAGRAREKRKKISNFDIKAVQFHCRWKRTDKQTAGAHMNKITKNERMHISSRGRFYRGKLCVLHQDDRTNRYTT